MGRRRGRGEGSVYRRKDGLWVGAITVGYTPTGQQKRLVVYGKTRQEAAAKLAEKLALYHRGALPQPEAITVRDWAERWLQGKARELKAKTVEHYRYELAQVLPSLKDSQARDRFGGMRLQAVQPLHVRELLEGVRDALPPSRFRQVRWLLHAIFEDALRMELVHRNPVAPVKVKVPSRGRAGRTLEPEEIRRLMAALDAHPTPLALALRLMLACGLRRGEALALTWGDIDLEAGHLTVRRHWTTVAGKGAMTTPKTPNSVRRVPVPPETLERLRAYRDALLQAGLREEDLPGLFLFPSRKSPSRPVEPNAPNHLLRRLCRQHGLPEIRVHDLRHTYGSFLLAQGAPVELVSERMGHANPTITLGIYRHLLEEERKGWVVEPGSSAT